MGGLYKETYDSKFSFGSVQI